MVHLRDLTMMTGARGITHTAMFTIRPMVLRWITEAMIQYLQATWFMHKTNTALVPDHFSRDMKTNSITTPASLWMIGRIRHKTILEHFSNVLQMV